MKTKVVFLAGFMGSGKSTIGPILANTIGWDFFDLDRVIEVKTGKRRLIEYIFSPLMQYVDESVRER